MTEYVVPVDLDMENDLTKSFAIGQIVELTDRGERVRIQKAHVDQIKGVKVEIFSNEHPPPHFRVKYQGSTANYRISDCVRINGSGEVVKYENNILKWWKANKGRLIQIWDDRRPADCPVGLYRA